VVFLTSDAVYPLLTVPPS
jgi:hypothetical protein